MSVQVWFHPACSKSNRAVAELDAAGRAYELRNYVDHPPSVAQLEQLAQRLGLQPWEFCRINESVAAELGLDRLPREVDRRADWFQVMHAHPILIQRPIVVDGDRAVVAREAGWLDGLDG